MANATVCMHHKATFREMVTIATLRTAPLAYICRRRVSKWGSMTMREYEHETSDVTGRDVCYAWVIAAVVLCFTLLLSLVLETSASVSMILLH